MSPALKVALLFVSVAVTGYGVFMTMDAIRRPSDQYPNGRKKTWVLGLLVLSPLIPVLAGTPLYAAVETYLVVALIYHASVRWRRPIRSVDDHEA
jgi:cytochrome c oxidase assembly factor CtaG